MTYSAHDADTQLAAARRAAHAWLRATLATLPAAVTSLSVGAVLDDSGDRPTLAPRLRASLMGGAFNYPVDQNAGETGTVLGDAMQALYDLDDDLRTHTAPFLFAIADEEWLTVTRADLAAPAGFHGVDPIPCPSAAEAETYRAIVAALTALPAGEMVTLRCGRWHDGVLTWEVVAP